MNVHYFRKNNRYCFGGEDRRFETIGRDCTCSGSETDKSGSVVFGRENSHPSLQGNVGVGTEDDRYTARECGCTCVECLDAGGTSALSCDACGVAVRIDGGVDMSNLGHEYRPEVLNKAAQRSDTVKRDSLARVIDKVKEMFSWKSVQPLLSFWPSHTAHVTTDQRMTTCNKPATVREASYKRPTHKASSGISNKPSSPEDSTPFNNPVVTPRSGANETSPGDCGTKCDPLTSHGGSQSSYKGSARSNGQFNFVSNDSGWIHLVESTASRQAERTTGDQKSLPPTPDKTSHQNFSTEMNPCLEVRAGNPTSASSRRNASRSPRPYGTLAVDSPTADRLVGLTFHCLLLSLLVMSVVLARWAATVLKFLFYMALHTAIYKGNLSPLREDTDEPITQDQLRDATVFDSTGLKIVLLQYRPPARRCIEYSNSSRLDTTNCSTDTTATTGISAQRSVPGPGSSSDPSQRGVAGVPRKSISVHSGSSQDLSHIFSASSS